MKTESKEKVMAMMTEAGFNVADATEFYDEPNDGIWVKSAMTEDASIKLAIELSYSYDSEPITEMLKDTGWTCQPYDSGTLMLYP